MNCSDCIARLHDYVDDDLAPSERHALEQHVEACPDCRQQLAALRHLLAAASALPRDIAPSSDSWENLRAALETPASRSSAVAPRAKRSAGHTWRWLAPFAVAASIVFLAGRVERGIQKPGTRPGWTVAAVAGTPQIDQKAITREARFHLGQWLETDASSRAKVSVGDIGTVTVDANSRLRLAGMAANDHRLELARGSMDAFIWAPPRLFFVDTPSATAVDLGCAYTLNVDDDGNGDLHVTLGYVALQHGDRESIIPMGMQCLTRRGAGPGTPFASDAPAPLRTALERFDFTPGATNDALREILTHAREQDVVTLWHLLARTSGGARAEVYDRFALLSPPPAGVTREGILADNVEMRRAWATAIGLGSF